MKELLIKIYHKLLRLYKNHQREKSDRHFRKNNSEIIKELERNRIFEKKYEGKRCFILGNGPSLKDVVFKDLANEYIFTVNQIARREDFSELKTNFHVWADPSFFNIDPEKEEDMELFQTMRSVKTNDNNPVVFFPIEQKTFCEEFGLSKSLNIFYFKRYGANGEYEKKNFDYTFLVPGFGTVVQCCITMAIYMGFSEIYLLGCDNTGIMVTLKSALGKNDGNDYTYTLTQNEKKRMEQLPKRNSVERYVYDYYRTFVDYARLYRICSESGIKLINCSSSTVIDSIPRKKLSEVLEDK